ncbi:hypothetical protein Tco_0556360 [Tanacetum coccineum]
MKAATYEIKWIEDLVRNLWNPVKVIYDKHAYLGTSHWGPKRQRFYRFASNMTSSKDVYSRYRKRLMRADELHKFSDGTLNDVQTTLHFISSGIRMEYMPKKKWSNLDKRRGWVMVQDIDKQLFERQPMRNLEKFVGGRVYRNDLRLLERTI